MARAAALAHLEKARIWTLFLKTVLPCDAIEECIEKVTATLDTVTRVYPTPDGQGIYFVTEEPDDEGEDA
jgi:hypothetical protein